MSDVVNKLWTAVRGSARELGDAVVDANGVRIFEQEIVEARDNISQAKRSLTEVMANKAQAERRVKELLDAISEHEVLAGKALTKNEEGLALEVAEKIAEFEAEKAEQDAIVVRLTHQIDALKNNIKKAEKLIVDHERELAIVKTTDSVQKATGQVVENIASHNSTLNSAKESLERIKKRQQMHEDKLAAGEALDAEFSGTDLETKLEDAGITGERADAAAILARIKKQKES